jgi:hypothetical protein
MLGSENLHSVGGDVTGPASSTNNAIARYDGLTGGIVQDSSVLIDDTNNLSGAKSITFTSSASNPGAGGTLWYNAGSGAMNIGSAQIVNAAASQTLTNKTLTAPIISSISNTGTITLPTDTTTLVGRNTTDTLTNKTITGATNLVDASALQTTGAAVNVSLAAPPTMGKVLTATSATTATWQAPAAQITTPGTTAVNRLVLWGDTTGDTLTQASMILDGTTFNATSDNMIVIDENGPNTGIGIRTLASLTTGAANAACGEDTLNALTSGSFNTAVGATGLQFLTTGSSNVAVGAALSYITTGSNNIGIGVGVGSNYTTSEANNIIIGTNVAGTAGESNRIRIGDSSHDNLFIGNRAMYKSTGGNCSFGSAPTATGTANSAFRSGALTTLTTGASNTAVGWAAMFVATTGGANCAFGRAALGSLTTGNNNVAIGNGAGSSYTTSESNNIIIGTTVSGTASKSNKIRIGSIQDATFIAGIRGTTTVNADAIPVLIDSAGQLGTVSSSIKYKENVADITEEESGVLDSLRPVSFNFKGQTKKTLGLIAEEVEHCYPEMCVYDADGELLTVDYSRLAILLLKEVQRLKKKIG